jgi:signal peptidase II
MLKRKYLILLALATFIVAIDQITKLYVDTHFQLGESLSIIPRFFSFTYVRNPGAAFGFLADSHPAFRELFFLSLPPFALIVILSILRSVPNSDTAQIIALSSVFGGATGNYIDRLRFRSVIDFLDFYYRSSDAQYRFYTWPTFNIADIAIVMGVFGLLILMIRDWSQQKRVAKAT